MTTCCCFQLQANKTCSFSTTVLYRTSFAVDAVIHTEVDCQQVRTCFDHAVFSLVIAIFWLMAMITGRLTTTTHPSRVTNSTCRPGQFRCRNGRCIPGRWVCNHEQDCPFAEDEPAHCREFQSKPTKKLYIA